MNTEHYIEESDLSVAWARAVHPMLTRGGPCETAPLIVAVTGFDGNAPRETPEIRKSLDELLVKLDLQTCATVANTIFPESFWNPKVPRSKFFERYESVLPRLRKASPKNAKGLYFERMLQGGPDEHPNQLDFVIANYAARKGVRRSALQISIYDPKVDQTAAAQAGFPCLQHVTFAPTKDGLCINAFYATQFAIERAYGNYLGLCALGRFVAHELNLSLTRMTCFTGIMKRDDNVRVTDLASMSQIVDRILKNAEVAA